MNKLEELLTTPGPVLLDGAMGTMLMDTGLEQGNPPEEWNVLHPERIREVHRKYIESGSRIILTNSFGGTRFRLKLHDLQDRAAETEREPQHLDADGLGDEKVPQLVHEHQRP